MRACSPTCLFPTSDNQKKARPIFITDSKNLKLHVFIDSNLLMLRSVISNPLNGRTETALGAVSAKIFIWNGINMEYDLKTALFLLETICIIQSLRDKWPLPFLVPFQVPTKLFPGPCSALTRRIFVKLCERPMISRLFMERVNLRH